jgi:hypothetical protein
MSSATSSLPSIEIREKAIPTIKVGHYINMAGGTRKFFRYDVKPENLAKIQAAYESLLNIRDDTSLNMIVTLDSQKIEFYRDGKFVKAEKLTLDLDKGQLLNTLSDVAKKELGDQYKPSHTFVEGLRGPVKSDRQQFESVGTKLKFIDSRLEKRRKSIKSAKDFIEKELPDMVAKDTSLDEAEVEDRVHKADKLMEKQKDKLESLLHEIEYKLTTYLDTDFLGINEDSDYKKFSNTDKPLLKRVDIALKMVVKKIEKKEEELKQAIEEENSDSITDLKQGLTSYKKHLKELQTTRNDIEGLLDFQKRVKNVDKLAIFWAAVYYKDGRTSSESGFIAPQQILGELGSQRSKLREHISKGGDHKVHGINIEGERLWIHDTVALSIEDRDLYKRYCATYNVPLSAPSIEEYFVRLSEKIENSNIDEVEALSPLKEHLLVPSTGNTISEHMRNRLKETLPLPPAGAEMETDLRWVNN